MRRHEGVRSAIPFIFSEQHNKIMAFFLSVLLKYQVLLIFSQEAKWMRRVFLGRGSQTGILAARKAKLQKYDKVRDNGA